MLRGSGPDGVIKAKDVESFVPGAAPVSGARPTAISAPRTTPPAGVEYMDIPLTSIRQVGFSVFFLLLILKWYSKFCSVYVVHPQAVDAPVSNMGSLIQRSTGIIKIMSLGSATMSKYDNHKCINITFDCLIKTFLKYFSEYGT